MISAYYRNQTRSWNLSNVPVSAFYRNRNRKSNRSRIGQCEQAVIICGHSTKKIQTDTLHYDSCSGQHHMVRASGASGNHSQVKPDKSTHELAKFSFFFCILISIPDTYEFGIHLNKDNSSY